MDIQLIKEIVNQMESSQTTILPESPHSRSEEYRAATEIYNHNKDKGQSGDFYCPICKNRKDYADVTESGTVIIKTCSCVRKREILENSRNSGMGGILLSKTFENFEQTEAWQKGIFKKVREFSDLANPSNCKWLCILGQSGIGKSHLCCAAAHKLLDDGANVVYMTWNNAVKELKRNATDDEAYSKLFDRYKNADVLYIDDLFKGKVTETDVTIAFELINYRYNDSKCITIISSELLLKDLFNTDEAIAGRIYERCGKNLMQVKPDTSKNYRRKGITEF